MLFAGLQGPATYQRWSWLVCLSLANFLAIVGIGAIDGGVAICNTPAEPWT